MDDFPKIDILVLNRNYDMYLERAIDSCLNQTYPSVNIIVADDNSTDGSRDILKKYSGSIKTILLDDKSPSISKTRNVLLGSSRSSYLCFLSSDDYFHPDFLTQAKNYLDHVHARDKEVQGCYTRFAWVNEDGSEELYPLGKFYQTRAALNGACCRPSCIVTFESALFMRSVFNYGIKFDEEVSIGEETLFIAQVTNYVNFLPLHWKEPLAFKQRHALQGHVAFRENKEKYLDIIRKKALQYKYWVDAKRKNERNL